MKKIGIIGSTGSIGKQALEVVRDNPYEYKVNLLSCNTAIEILAEQIIEFKPEAVVLPNEKRINTLKELLSAHNINLGKNTSNKGYRPEILIGTKGLDEGCRYGDFKVLLNSLVGVKGLSPTYEAISARKDIALANKETLVSGGSIVTEKAKEKGVEIIPVDSEHSAIYQSLTGSRREDLKKIILTCSGGPFRGYKKENLKQVTMENALNHPKWSMGKKITIDSATLMNKGLEYIEAKWLFDIKSKDEIEVLIHPESIMHSAVLYKDGSVIGQLGLPDMKVPISYALSKPKRLTAKGKLINFAKLGKMTFSRPDYETFSCLKIAENIAFKEASFAVAMNGANEILVEHFLKGEIGFLDIEKGIYKVLDRHIPKKISCLEEILEIDLKARAEAENIIKDILN